MSEPSTELLPCPMCGATPKHRYTLNAGFIVFCVCGIQTGYSEEGQAVIEAWNHRANRWSGFETPDIQYLSDCIDATGDPYDHEVAHELGAELIRRAEGGKL